MSDVHTVHCCTNCGCKYCDPACTVVANPSTAEHPLCWDCKEAEEEFNSDPKVVALRTENERLQTRLRDREFAYGIREQSLLEDLEKLKAVLEAAKELRGWWPESLRGMESGDDAISNAEREDVERFDAALAALDKEKKP